MFYGYDIRNNGQEDVLYLYMTMQYEFSNEFTLEDNAVELKTQNFIKTNDINFKGNKVCVVMDGKVVKCLTFNNLKTQKENYLADSLMVNICLDDNSLCEVSLREYLLGVLMSKYMDSLHVETIKAMTILYQTFAFKMMEENNCILSNNRFAIFKPYDYYKADMKNYDIVIEKLNEAIDEVDGMYLGYGNLYVLPFMHYSNSGKTLANKYYPYLSSVKSLWDLASPYYIDIKDYTYKELNKKLNISLNNLSEVEIKNDNYKKLKLGNNVFSMEEIKNILNLKSTDIYIIVNKDFLRIISKGWGNSYGLSIFGSDEIAKNGCKYYNILKYYFPKTKLYKKDFKAK